MIEARKGYQKMTVGELREILATHSRDTTGKKAVLIARLTEATSATSNLDQATNHAGDARQTPGVDEVAAESTTTRGRTVRAPKRHGK
ncbi:hypothetical protein ABBQ32_002382 [Trebouxia sp. C0010 RCD-2024]